MTTRLFAMLFLLFTSVLLAGVLLVAPEARACGPYCDMPGDRGGVAYYMDNAVACEAACDRTQGCHGWTWVKPGLAAPQAVCWLKKEVVATMRSDCCISGYRGDRTAAASVRVFRIEGDPGAKFHVPPTTPSVVNPPPRRDTRAWCDCKDETGRPYRGALGMGCDFGLRDYECVNR